MYDTIIIGSGPAGMTAALYAARSNLKVALIEQGAPGGQMNNTSDIENYPGYDLISGPELSMKMHEPLEKFGVENLYGIVTAVEDHGNFKKVLTDDNSYETKTVIIATGAKHRPLAVAGEETYNSRGVSYCAVCDGAFFRGQDLLVVGGGDSAVEEALFLTRFANKVTIVHRRDELRAQKVLQERAFANDKVDFIWDSVVKEIKGNDLKVTNVDIENVKTGQVNNYAFGGVFIYVGLDPVSSMVKELDITDEAGWIPTDDHMKTKVAGVFAIGDVRQKDLRQITTAVGDGAVAAQEAYQYIVNNY
ncbi:thioredoxin-disulfide reductase [Streptococcus mutans]|jgi:thioredoxin-disulfide reductase|uniref:Thioredoxin reductase n=1 Tax=Streptococcus mutans serotype c (strain ATCC 700610 / UA159) TaxID=210007 RepID=Q8DVL7_STRMU|nr:thioredoxin-disulfide reductase [Streptococcus mutans]AAN58212.1 putative thioredoxin reductase (NADPH) [Streptococcus mutans UA159]AJD54872.1 thioredoxin reductase [Streptococcus mutans UA159-FR]EMB57938.1 putative thioredoxin reductase (NADPH) [Streptococcus mutans 8ID3]EMC62387.1 putative thioredoxin reductase (NADPH) [Streptococcus mutans U2B]EMP57986.1 thioredoxin reductase [Streptococcus mutans KK21]